MSRFVLKSKAACRREAAARAIKYLRGELEKYKDLPALERLERIIRENVHIYPRLLRLALRVGIFLDDALKSEEEMWAELLELCAQDDSDNPSLREEYLYEKKMQRWSEEGRFVSCDSPEWKAPPKPSKGFFQLKNKIGKALACLKGIYN